jgi:hypothetical protein
MGLWPFKALVMRAPEQSGTEAGAGAGGEGGSGRGSSDGRSSAGGAGRVPVEYLFHFGDAEFLCAALGLTNRLTGYRASGPDPVRNHRP